jgi:hypothetical protein
MATRESDENGSEVVCVSFGSGAAVDCDWAVSVVTAIA